MIRKAALIILIASIQGCAAFTVAPLSLYGNKVVSSLHPANSQSIVVMKAEENGTAATSEVGRVLSREEITDSLVIPLSFSEMVQEVSTAMEDAYAQEKKRQIVRILLPRNSENERLGLYSEGTPDAETQDTVLVPPDESWQGGIMQLYYSAGPSCEAILRRFTRNAPGGIPPKIVEDRSVDESGVDGIGLFTVDLEGSISGSKGLNGFTRKMARCYVQPNQEIIDSVEQTSNDRNSDLVCLLNPQWRVTDDAFDKASREDSIFGKVASFLGGKGGALKRLDDMNFESIYTFEGYICRGYKVRLLKRFDSDWVIFCEKGYGFEKVGTATERPTYQQVEEKLVQSGFGYKYAEEMGF